MTIMRIIVFAAVFTILTMNLYAQFSLDEFPLNIQSAYKNGTRSLDGKSGDKYWQNRSEYDIRVELVPAKKLIKGTENIIYTNNSPDTLNQLVIRLYPDMYKKGNDRDFAINERDLHDGVDILFLSIDDEEIDVDNTDSPATRSGTNMTVLLNKPLLPGDELEVMISWRYRLPQKTPVRTGAYSDSAFFVAYWYPQIAVYDDIDGWDLINYSGTLEFYNDINDFEVEITMPGGYIVWATGELQNAEDILSDAVYERFASARTSDSVMQIVDLKILESGNYLKNQGKHTWVYQAQSVPDFVFGASNYFLWDGTSVIADYNKNRRVFVQAAYPPDSPDFHEVAQISSDVIGYLSSRFPGVPYPYPTMTAFNRPDSRKGGGMEYPMMINDGSHTSRAKTVGLTIHEIAHTYFPFYMGTNERKYSFMDEGWAHMFPFVIQTVLEPASDPVTSSVKVYTEKAGQETELPMMIPSESLGRTSYRLASYNRPGIAYYILRDLLGSDLFDNALREFIRRWNGKHPIPYDFFFTFNEYSQKDLSWFWKPWFFEHGYPDLAIGDVDISDEYIDIEIKRIGRLPVPVNLKIEFKDSNIKKEYKTAEVWHDYAESIKFRIPASAPIERIELGSANIPDINTENNFYVPEEE